MNVWLTTRAMRSPAQLVMSSANKGSVKVKNMDPMFSPPFGISRKEIIATTPSGYDPDSNFISLILARGIVLYIIAP